MQEIPREPLEEAHQLTYRILRLAGRTVLAGVALCCITSLGQRVLLLRETNRATAQETVFLQRQLEAAKKERRDLEEEQRFLQTPAGIIAEARRLGYGFPGEIRLMPVPEEDQGPARE
jgi:hypothetical protein